MIFLLAGNVPFAGAETVSILPDSSMDLPQQSISHPVGGSQNAITLYGIASWYSESDPFINLHTANGEVFNDRALTCATWHFSFGSYLRVENLDNGKSVVCRVNGNAFRRRDENSAARNIFGIHKGRRMISLGVAHQAIGLQPRVAAPFAVRFFEKCHFLLESQQVTIVA